MIGGVSCFARYQLNEMVLGYNKLVVALSLLIVYFHSCLSCI